MRILMVDDNEELRELVRLVLEQEGHAVRCAKDGVEALEILQCWEPAVMIADVDMPRMSGRELVLALRRHHGTSLPFGIVMISGAAPGSLLTQWFLAKPFTFDVLLRAIDAAASNEARAT